MPGRKSLLLISSIIGFSGSIPQDPRLRDNRSEYSPQFNRLADEALRNGVVIHMLDIKGLIAPFYRPEYSAEFTDIKGLIPAKLFQPPNQGEYILAQKTGGITIKNTNFSLNGIGQAHEVVKGYYLLSYIPPADTFEPDKRRKYHRIKIKVKRRFSQVHSRDGFYGEALPADDVRPVQNKSPLREAIFSPFLCDDLTVRLASGYANKPDTGYFLRSWMHLDAKDLTFIDEQDGGSAVSLEIATITTDSYGQIQDSMSGTLDYYVRNEDLDRIGKSGINFDLYLPVKKPGAYYVRAAIRDQASGKIGTACQFLEIPDLKKKRLSLSSIFVVKHREDISGFGSKGIEQSKYGPGSVLSWQDVRKGQAIRNYLPGERFNYMAIAYNAKNEKKQAPELETQFVLYKDDREIFKGDINPVGLRGIDDFHDIPISGSLFFSEAIDPGRYVLQLMVTDKQAKKEYSVATQAMDFEIQEKD